MPIGIQKRTLVKTTLEKRIANEKLMQNEQKCKMHWDDNRQIA